MGDDGEAALDREIMEALAEMEAAAPRRGRRKRGSNRYRGFSAAERKARQRRRERRERMIEAFNRLAHGLPRWAMDQFEASGVLPQALMDALDADWRQDVIDWKLATGLDYGPLTRREKLALQAWRQDRAPRPQAGPPRDFPTARYEEPWLARLGRQVQAENAWDGADSFKNDFAAAEFLRRQLQRVGPVKRLRLRNGRTAPAVTAYNPNHPRACARISAQASQTEETTKGRAYEKEISSEET
jgi:hypothetical protein